MSFSDSVCGVLLYDCAYQEIGAALDPYVNEGTIGKFIYCKSAIQNGAFLVMTFKPEQCDPMARVVEDMTISVPLKYVKFMVEGEKSLPIGFLSYE
jgi:hypothetical protein